MTTVMMVASAVMILAMMALIKKFTRIAVAIMRTVTIVLQEKHYDDNGVIKYCFRECCFDLFC